jgi:hypothetical protein
MECTKCKKRLELIEFSYKNEQNKIFYLHCDTCRNKENNLKKKSYEKNQYNEKKETCKVNCKCGKIYIAFRDYHIKRHECTLFHIKNITK